MNPVVIFAQVGGAIPSSPLELIRQATPVTQAVLIVLAVLSLISWAVIFGVWIQLSTAHTRAAKFAADFDRTRRMDEANALARRSTKNALARLFLTASHFMIEARGATLRIKETVTADTGTVPNTTLTGSQVEALHLLLDAEADTERERLGRYTPWLATIGSVSPLLGLLGTVIGVIQAFIGIATKGSGNLSAVAPGVAEALVATAASLAVAIPATFGYNILASRVNRFDSAMERFNAAVIARFAREGQI
ncbi:MAG TPA: MotA/TolQ/ExbB proton channel family protein [Gemmatimonadaceae bacterium]|nr:MotA/TolQ/ExbB proton channel family protein [Gemmatimonadaceae bacterium]